MTLERREFLKSGAYGLLANIASTPLVGSDRSLFRFSADLSESPQQVVATLVEIMENHGVHTDPGMGSYYSGYGPSLYTWEIFFDSILLLHVGDTSLGKNAIRMYLSTQRENGFIPRHWRGETPVGEEAVWQIYESEEHAQPFLFQTALFLTRASGGDVSWITADMYQALKKYLQHWKRTWDRDSNGLCEWASACQSGEDNQFDRAGVWRSYFCEGVDLNSFLYLDLLAAEKIASAMGYGEDAVSFAKEASAKKGLIQKLLWDEKDGFFYDRDIRTGKPIRIKSVAGLFPLWAGIPDHAQAKRIVDEHIMNPKEFWNSHPLPSYSIDERNFTQHHVPPPLIDIYYALSEGHSNWLGGTWGHSNYFVAHGLQRYGFDREAKLLAKKSYEVSAPDKVVFEWYNSELEKALVAVESMRALRS